MDERILPLLCDPETHENLRLDTGSLASATRRYPIREGIPCFVEEVSGNNRKYRQLYDRIAPGYDFIERLYSFILRINREGKRRTYLDELELRPGARMLEVSVGTGANIQLLPPDLKFFGLDLSWGMLTRCRRNLKRWGRKAELFLGEGERLPFKDGTFDSVLHYGGINFFNDRARAIAEMVRVAKPGTKIVISDETEKVVQQNYRRSPVTGKYFKDTEPVVCPVDLIPEGASEVRSFEFAKGRLYCLCFRTPR